MRSLVFFPFLTLLLLLLLVTTFTSISFVTASIIPRSTANSSHHHDGRPRIAIFISIPLQGHLNPLVAQANELASRGWLSYLAAPQSIRSHAEKRIKDGVQWLEIGECGGDQREQEFKEISHKGTNTTDETEGLYNIFAWFCRFHECAYPGTINAINKLPYRPSILVVDFGTTFGFAVAETLNIPMVVNNADLLSLISTDIVLASDYIPLTTSMISIHDVGLGLVPRIINPIIRFLARWYLHFNQNALLNEERAKVGLPPVNMFTWLANNVIFVNSAFGLEYPRPIPPNVQMTGPMIDHRGDEKAEKLSAEDDAWLSADSRPVVWVSMGTLAPLHYWQVQELAKGLSNPEYRVIWKLRDEEKAFLPSHIAPTIRVTKWVSSQLGVLKHTNTKVFISHCGINSVHEAVYYMVNLLCIPMFGDQPDQGVRVVDQGVGLTASKLNFTGPEIESKLLEIIRDKTGSYRDNAVRVRSAMKLAGGVTRAADVIEDVAQFGFSAYVPLDASYPWYARNQWDVLAVYVIILWLLKKLCSSCCGFGRKCTSSRPSKQKTQ